MELSTQLDVILFLIFSIADPSTESCHTQF